MTERCCCLLPPSSVAEFVRPAAVSGRLTLGSGHIRPPFRLFSASFQVGFRLLLTCCNDTGAKPEHGRVEAGEIQQVPAQSLALQQRRQQVLSRPAVMQRADGLMEQVAQRIQCLPQGFPRALSISGGMPAAVLQAVNS